MSISGAHSLSFGTGSLIGSELTNWGKVTGHRHRVLLASFSPVLGLQVHITPGSFTWVLRIDLRVTSFQGKYLPTGPFLIRTLKLQLPVF